MASAKKTRGHALALREAEELIEQGELRKAKVALGEILDQDPTNTELDRIIVATNTILALEIIEYTLSSNKKATIAVVDRVMEERTKEKEANFEAIGDALDKSLDGLG
jgi:thioredoxin-like negative regulator of GroEL